MTSYQGLPDFMTISGKFFPFLDPIPSDISIGDIANSLSMTCCLGGHVKQFYSIAEHSVRVSYLCEPRDALYGLLHAAPAAYLNHLRPEIKHELPRYQTMESIVMRVTANRFDIPEFMPASVEYAEAVLQATEGRDLCAPEYEYWKIPVKPLDKTITPWTQQVAKARFLNRFKDLTC